MYNGNPSKPITQSEQDESLARKYTGAGITAAIENFNRTKLTYQALSVTPAVINQHKPAAVVIRPVQVSTNVAISPTPKQPIVLPENTKPAVSVNSALVISKTSIFKPAAIKEKPPAEDNIVTGIHQRLDSPEALLSYIQSLKP